MACDASTLPKNVLAEIQDRMSAKAALIREPKAVSTAVENAWTQWLNLDQRLRVTGRQGLPMACRVMDLCLTHVVYLEAVASYLEGGGGSRGGVMVLDAEGTSCGAGLGGEWSFRQAVAESEVARQILEVSFKAPDQVAARWTDVRPIPESDSWFEQVWAEFRAGDVFLVSEEE